MFKWKIDGQENIQIVKILYNIIVYSRNYSYKRRNDSSKGYSNMFWISRYTILICEMYK